MIIKSVIHLLICCVFVIQDVTPQNFLAVLTGNVSAVKGGSGKVLKRQVTVVTNRVGVVCGFRVCNIYGSM